MAEIIIYSADDLRDGIICFQPADSCETRQIDSASVALLIQSYIAQVDTQPSDIARKPSPGKPNSTNGPTSQLPAVEAMIPQHQAAVPDMKRDRARPSSRGRRGAKPGKDANLCKANNEGCMVAATNTDAIQEGAGLSCPCNSITSARLSLLV